MLNRLHENLELSEKATIIYVNYIDQHGKNWSLEEMAIAKETLGTLIAFCHEIKNFINFSLSNNIDKESELYLITYLPKIELISNHIINELEQYIKI